MNEIYPGREQIPSTENFWVEPLDKLLAGEFTSWVTNVKNGQFWACYWIPELYMSFWALFIDGKADIHRPAPVGPSWVMRHLGMMDSN